MVVNKKKSSFNHQKTVVSHHPHLWETHLCERKTVFYHLKTSSRSNGFGIMFNEDIPAVGGSATIFWDEQLRLLLALSGDWRCDIENLKTVEKCYRFFREHFQDFGVLLDYEV